MVCVHPDTVVEARTWAGLTCPIGLALAANQANFMVSIAFVGRLGYEGCSRVRRLVVMMPLLLEVDRRHRWRCCRRRLIVTRTTAVVRVRVCQRAPQCRRSYCGCRCR
jgi:hypothetical protein